MPVGGGRQRKLWGLTMYHKDDLLVGHLFCRMT